MFKVFSKNSDTKKGYSCQAQNETVSNPSVLVCSFQNPAGVPEKILWRNPLIVHCLPATQSLLTTVRWWVLTRINKRYGSVSAW